MQRKEMADGIIDLKRIVLKPSLQIYTYIAVINPSY
jgi:hypothetical protein